MKQYSCWWPDCDYCTDSRSKIDYHHVTPKEVNPHKSNKATVSLCKTHHALIYHPEAASGQHAIKSEDSLIIQLVTSSSNGRVILYEDMSGNSMTYYIRTGETFYG